MKLRIKEFYKEKYWREIKGSWYIAARDILVYRLSCGHKISFSEKDFYESLIDDQNCMECWMCHRLDENETHH